MLTGWVKNCDDKSVECEVSGKRENIDLFLNACNKGPLLANVKSIQKKEWSNLLKDNGLIFDLKGIIPRELKPFRL